MVEPLIEDGKDDRPGSGRDRSVNADLAAAELKLLAASLSKDIREDFLESIKRVLWVVAIVASIATAGGLLTLSDLLTNRIDAAIQGRYREIEQLRSGLMNALIDVRAQAVVAQKEVDGLNAQARAALKDVDVLRAQGKMAFENVGTVVEQAKTAHREVEGLNVATKGASKQLTDLQNRVRQESDEALSTIRGLTLSVTSTVEPSGQTSTSVAAQLREAAPASPTSAGRASPSWFGNAVAGFLGVAGSAFNEVGYETNGRGAFSVAFQAALLDPASDSDSNGEISIGEAVRRAGLAIERQTPVVAGDANVALFAKQRISVDQKPARKIYAILIGISQYRRNPLIGPRNDVEAFAKLLQNEERLLAQNAEVSLLLDANATGDAIFDTIGRLGARSTADDLVLVYFAGHRTEVNRGTQGAPALEKALVPYDLESGRLVLVSDLIASLQRLKARLRVLIADV